MRVVLLAIPAEARTGFGRYASGLASGLAQTGVDVRTMGVPKTEVDLLGQRLFGDTLTRLRLRTTHRPPRDPDTIVHATNPMLATGASDVVTVHDVIPIKQNGARSRGWRDSLHTLRVADILKRLGTAQVVVPTEHVAGDLEAMGVPGDRLTVTYEGVDTDTFHPDDPHAGMTSDQRHVLMVGDLARRKRWELVLEAVHELPDVHIWHAGTFVGEAPDRYHRLADSLGDRYHRLERVADDELRRLYSGCDVFVLPTMDEGFGLPPLEAMACGAPVVVSDIPVLHEVLGDHARYAELTAEGIRDAVRAALEAGPDAGREDRLAHARSYTWRAAAERTTEAYERVQNGA